MLIWCMNIEDATRLREIVDEMTELLDEAKSTCQASMSRVEYEQFRHKTLAHLEPGLIFDHEWVTNAVPLEKVADHLLENAQAEEDDDDDEE